MKKKTRMTEKEWMDKKDKVGCRADFKCDLIIRSMTDRPIVHINCSLDVQR